MVLEFNKTFNKVNKLLIKLKVKLPWVRGGCCCSAFPPVCCWRGSLWLVAPCVGNSGDSPVPLLRGWGGRLGGPGGLRYRLHGHKALLRLASNVCYVKGSHEARDGGAGVGSPSVAVMPPRNACLCPRRAALPALPPPHHSQAHARCIR